MRAALSMALGLVVALALVTIARAADKEETLKGTIACAKCDLKEPGRRTCQTVVKVTKDGKDTIYYFGADSSKKFHKPICMEAKKGTVTGTVSEKDGKHWIKATKVDFD